MARDEKSKNLNKINKKRKFQQNNLINNINNSSFVTIHTSTEPQTIERQINNKHNNNKNKNNKNNESSNRNDIERNNSLIDNQSSSNSNHLHHQISNHKNNTNLSNNNRNHSHNNNQSKNQKNKNSQQIQSSSNTNNNRNSNSNDNYISAYKREVIYPTPCLGYNGPTNRFLTPNDSEFQRVFETSYSGCTIETYEEFPINFHEKFLESLNILDLENIYQFDITQPAGLGTKTAKTFVTRCLVGDAGMTYKYLGLRMFAIPWDLNNDQNNNDDNLSNALNSLYQLNQTLITHTKSLLEKQNKPIHGYQYNLTLINRYSSIRHR